MGKKKTNRRQFLSQAGTTMASAALANGPFLALLDAIAGGSIQRAYADANGIAPRKWLDLKWDSAPPRWVYDLFLKPFSADNLNFSQSGNKQLATRYTESNGVYTGAQFASSLVKNIQAPYLWKFAVPDARGGTRAMADLLTDMLHIRGINAGNQAHDGAAALHFTPLGALTSLPAMVGDASQSPISGINVGARNYVFKSHAAKSAVSLLNGNLITALLSPFHPSTPVAAVKDKEAMVQAYVDAARASLRNSALARDPDAVLAREAVDGARALMTRSFGDLNAVWDGLVAKYQDLVTRAIHQTYVGINDKAIGGGGVRDTTYRYDQNAGADAMVNGDLRAMIGADTNLPSLPRAFAFAEFVLLNDLSDSLTLNLSGFTNIKIGAANIDWNMDEHFVGVMPSLLINSLMSFAHAACLLELIDRLKAARLWNETIINNSAEFNRAPKTAGDGADHGYQGASTVIYSGIITGPMILGNIAKEGTPTSYKGTWGFGAPQTELNNTQIDRGNVAATYAALLRVPSPVTARTSLVNVSGNSVIPLIASGKILT